jgi:hypothetical protein
MEQTETTSVVPGYSHFEMHDLDKDYGSYQPPGHGKHMTQVPRSAPGGAPEDRRLGRYGKIVPGRILKWRGSKNEGYEEVIGTLGTDHTNPFFTKKRIKAAIPDNPQAEEQIATVLNHLVEQEKIAAEEIEIVEEKDESVDTAPAQPVQNTGGWVEKSKKTFKVMLKSSNFGMFKGEYIYYTIEDDLLILCYNIESSVFTPPPSQDAADDAITIIIKDGKHSKSYKALFTGINFELEDFGAGIQVFCKVE